MIDTQCVRGIRQESVTQRSWRYFEPGVVKVELENIYLAVTSTLFLYTDITFPIMLYHSVTVCLILIQTNNTISQVMFCGAPQLGELVRQRCKAKYPSTRFHLHRESYEM